MITIGYINCEIFQIFGVFNKDLHFISLIGITNLISALMTGYYLARLMKVEKITGFLLTISYLTIGCVFFSFISFTVLYNNYKYIELIFFLYVLPVIFLLPLNDFGYVKATNNNKAEEVKQTKTDLEEFATKLTGTNLNHSLTYINSSPDKLHLHPLELIQDKPCLLKVLND